MKRLATALCVLLLAASSPMPRPTPTPILELHRTAAGAHFEPYQTNPLFVLVIGSDIREGDPNRGRADSLHIVAVNTQRMEGTIVGIPRDSYVNIPGFGVNKINAALEFGGPAKVTETVSALTGLPIHFYATVEFSRFRQLVDNLGGIDVDVPYQIVDSFSGANFSPGRRHMNGAEALAMSRARHGVPLGDFGRSSNQGLVLLAGLAKFRSEAANPYSLLHWTEAFRIFASSNVGVKDFLSLGLLGRRLDPTHFANIVVPGGGGSAGGASIVVLNEGATAIFNNLRDDGLLL